MPTRRIFAKLIFFAICFLPAYFCFLKIYFSKLVFLMSNEFVFPRDSYVQNLAIECNEAQRLKPLRQVPLEFPKNRKKALRTSVTTALTTTMAGLLLSTYGGNRANAGSCTGTVPNIVCSNGVALTDSTQAFTGVSGLDVSTLAGFDIDTFAATTPGGDALALQNSNTGNLTFTDNYVSIITGNDSGISARNFGTGAMSITTNGQVNGGDGDGILAYNTPGVSLTIDANVVYGSQNGISADAGSGAVSITTNGMVDGISGYGIFAVKNGSGNLEITANDQVYGGTTGIAALLIGTGAGSLTITTSALVTGNGPIGAGIYGFNATGTGGVSIDAASVTGDSAGIRVHNANGNTLIETSGPVTAINGRGIDSYSFGGSGSMTINTLGTVYGYTYGISADHKGSGTLTVTTTGDISSVAGDGIFARSYNSNMRIDVVNVAGSDSGINTFQYGTFATDIFVSGLVQSTNSGHGISASTEYSAATNTITLNSGAGVRGAGTGAGIYNDRGNVNVIINANADITGDLRLNDGSDAITFNTGSDFSNIVNIDGGDDVSSFDGFIDVLNFDGVNASSAGVQLNGWERINVSNASSVVFSNTFILAGPEELNITGGSTFSIGGDLDQNGGIIDMRDSNASDQLMIGGDMAGIGSTLFLDVDVQNDTADEIIISGNVTSTPSVINLTVLNANMASGNDITIVDVAGTSGAADFTLAGGQVIAGSLIYELEQDGSDWVLRNAVSGVAGDYEAYQSALLDQASLSTYAERVSARYFDGTGENFGRRVALWSRASGGATNRSDKGSSGGTSYDLTQGGIDAGFDAVVADLATGTLYGGLNVGFGQSTTKTVSELSKGTIKTTSFTIGGGVTFAGNDGFYADMQAKHIWFNSDISNTMFTNLAKGVDATAIVAGMEVGKRFATHERFDLIPQAQLTYAHLSTDGFTDGSGSDVSFKDADSLTLRVGLAAEADIGTNGDMGKVRVLGNLTHEFMGDSKGTASGTDFGRDRANWTGELGVGFTFGNTTDGLSFHGEASLESDLNDMGDSYSAKGTLGVRLKL